MIFHSAQFFLFFAVKRNISAKLTELNVNKGRGSGGDSTRESCRAVKEEGRNLCAPVHLPVLHATSACCAHAPSAPYVPPT